MSNCFDPHQYHVALLCGGRGGEREVSLASGVGAGEALIEAGFQVTTLDPADKGALKRLIEESFDVAFLCLHGKYGEDGTIQGFLETIGLPYTGSGIWSSALAIDKVKSKVYYEQEGIFTPPSLALHKGEPYDGDVIVSKLGTHCVVKPSTEGSTLGVFIVQGALAITDAIEKAFELDSEVLVERYIKGKELTVAVVGNEDVEALPIIEIVPKNDFYDYESKYAPGGSEHRCPAPLPEETTRMVQDLAVRAHRVLSCKGVSRTDFILEEDGSCWTLETNTIPGMTGTSLLPDAARAAGITFPELCTRFIKYALA